MPHATCPCAACGGLLAGMGMLQEPPPALPEGDEGTVLHIAAAPATNTAPAPSLPPTSSSTPALTAGAVDKADNDRMAAMAACQQVVAPPPEGGDQGDAWRPAVVTVDANGGGLSCHRIELGSEDEADAGSEGSMSVDELEDLYELD